MSCRPKTLAWRPLHAATDKPRTLSTHQTSEQQPQHTQETFIHTQATYTHMLPTRRTALGTQPAARSRLSACSRASQAS